MVNQWLTIAISRETYALPRRQIVSPASRTRLLLRGAFSHDRRAESGPQIVGQLIELGVAIDFDGLFRRIANHIAVVAPSQVVVEFGLRSGVQHTIEVVG